MMRALQSGAQNASPGFGNPDSHADSLAPEASFFYSFALSRLEGEEKSGAQWLRPSTVEIHGTAEAVPLHTKQVSEAWLARYKSLHGLPGEILHVAVFGQTGAPRSVQHLCRLVVIHGAAYRDQIITAFGTENLSTQIRVLFVDLRDHVVSLGLPLVRIGNHSPDG